MTVELDGRGGGVRGHMAIPTRNGMVPLVKRDERKEAVLKTDTSHHAFQRRATTRCKLASWATEGKVKQSEPSVNVWFLSILSAGYHTGMPLRGSW